MYSYILEAVSLSVGEFHFLLVFVVNYFRLCGYVLVFHSDLLGYLITIYLLLSFTAYFVI